LQEWKNVDKSLSGLDSAALAAAKGSAPVTGEWAPNAGLPPGEYEIRVLTQCSLVVGAPDEYMQSSTTVIRGVVDMVAPKIVAVQTSTKGTFEDTDVITVTYTEPILCIGYNQADGNPILPIVVATIRGIEFKSDAVGNILRYECHGSVVQLSLGNTQKHNETQ